MDIESRRRRGRDADIQWRRASHRRYYADASADQRVCAVDAPLLVVNAADDPIALTTVKRGVFDYDAVAANDNLVVAVTARGGHLGWVDAADPTGPPDWAQETVLDFLDAARREAPP